MKIEELYKIIRFFENRSAVKNKKLVFHIHIKH